MTLGSFTDPLLFLLLLLLLRHCGSTAAAVLLLRQRSRRGDRLEQSQGFLHRTPDQQEGPDQGGSASR